MAHPNAALFVALSPVAPAGGFRVPPERRVKNEAPGYCAWAAIETIAKSRARLYPDDANYQKLLTLVDVRKRMPKGEPCVEIHPDGRRVETAFHPADAYPNAVKKQLDALGVKYRDNLPVIHGGKKDFAFIKRACDDGFGAMVAVKNCEPVATNSHALAVTEVSDDEEEFTSKGGTKTTDVAVYYYDSNDPSGTFRVSKTWFMAAWDGWAVVVEPQGERVNPPVATVGPDPYSQYPHTNRNTPNKK
jgi:hypothetical protein